MLVEQRHKEPCRLQGAGRSGQSPFGLAVEDGNREVKLYPRSGGAGMWEEGGLIHPSPKAAEVRGSGEQGRVHLKLIP